MVDFDWTPEQKALYDQAVEFGQKRMNHDLARNDREEIFPRDKWQACAEMGIFGLPVPEEYGGLGQNALTCARTMEGLGYGSRDLGFFLAIGAHVWAVEMPILLYGSDELKQKYLPKLASGEWVGCHAMSEPGSGSDAMSMNTRADLDGEEYVLNGRKTFATNAPEADLFVTFATVNKKMGFAAVTAFVVERNTPGVSVEKRVEKMGSHTAPMADVVFEDVRIPMGNRIGKANLGWKIFNRIMQWERGLILAPYLGAMQRQVEDCVRYANQRRQFGKPLAAYQAVTDKIVEMQFGLEIGPLADLQGRLDARPGGCCPGFVAGQVGHQRGCRAYLPGCHPGIRRLWLHQ